MSGPHPQLLLQREHEKSALSKSAFLVLVTIPLGRCLPQFLTDEIPWHVIPATQIALDALSSTVLESRSENCAEV